MAARAPRLRRYARALTRDVSQADDLVQDTLVRALAKQHLWQPGTERLLGVEGWPLVDEPGQHRIGVAQMRTCSLQPRGMAGISGHHVYVTFPVPVIRMLV